MMGAWLACEILGALEPSSSFLGHFVKFSFSFLALLYFEFDLADKEHIATILLKSVMWYFYVIFEFLILFVCILSFGCF
ncbi:hypothetical protein L1987_10413 [Smallanthus sonchifolius]|uniref:Uncharacterized protein n=1 Tax=Smallanthus sonchifolius TaxID=185202 RepID=A0ACB9JS54_9ASTR|nr:hypothetical protein L1987_10413 [Smallanthus sonchifolius]